jgi:hypothetical protein
LRDVGQVLEGAAVQQNIVRESGRRVVLLSVIKWQCLALAGTNQSMCG